LADFNTFMADPRTSRWVNREPLVAVHGLTKSFGSRTAVRDLSLTIGPGAVFGLIGANGGGKTTTLRLLAGLLRPDAGAGTVLGHDILRSPKEIRRCVGYMSQHFSLYANLTVIENLRFRAEIYELYDPQGTVQETVARFGLERFSKTPAGRLSGGWMRRLQLAAALIHAPGLILLDEPTAGLDVLLRKETWRWIFALADEGAAVVVSTHDLAEAEDCTNVTFFADGEIRASGSPLDLALQVATRLGTVSDVTGLGLEDIAAGLLAPTADNSDR
jgi:ABC-2 type transport system ATP-binding protein